MQASVELDQVLLQQPHDVEPPLRGSISDSIFRQNKLRADAERYDAIIGKRQARINQHVVTFAQDLLSEGDIVIDACIGTGGILKPATDRGYQVVANDLSHERVRKLEQSGAALVTNFDFAYAPYTSGISNAVFFVFALNSFASPRQAIATAHRVIKPEGIVAIADTGPEKATADKIIYGLLPEQRDFLLDKKSKDDVRRHFSNRSYTPGQFARFYLANSLGIVDQTDFQSKLKKVISRAMEKSDGKISHVVQRYLSEYFFQFLDHSAQAKGLIPVKAAIMTADTTSSQVSEPVMSSPKRWISDTLSTRKRGSMTNGKTVNVPSTYSTLVFPVVIYQKPDVTLASAEESALLHRMSA